MQRYFAQEEQICLEKHRIELGPDDRNHMKNVLRLKAGDVVWVSDGRSKEYRCAIEEYTASSVVLHIQYAQEPSYELPGEIVLYQGLPKADKMELIIQKAVELGASRVVIVGTRRCVARLEEGKQARKLERWNLISESAARQSRRLRIPEVGPYMSFEQALKDAAGLDTVLIPYELEEGMDQSRQVIGQIRPGQSIGIFIGPEGGFEEEEIRMARQAGAVPISLGHRILRTETAGLALLSVLMFQLDR